MVFAYCNRLTRAQQRVYKQSGDVSSIRVPNIAALSPFVERLAEALEREERRETEAVCQRLASSLTAGLHNRAFLCSEALARMASML